MTPAPTRRADPYCDLDVVDARAPRTLQATIGSLALVAVLTGFWPILGLLAAQLAIGLRFGRRYCLPCRPTSSSSSRASARDRSRTAARRASRTGSA